ncbi:MAG: glutamate 5-kinase [Steroidobacteraceae bacterium]|jgi:glutamate 5-kinase|nr:glutamate 5-kinase [Steroidobacteraceae bacterium]
MSQSEFRSRARRLVEARRLVVKVGSALLVDAKTGRVNRAWLESLVDDLARAHGRGQQVIVVSSGAIAMGRRHLGLPAGRLRLEESQAAAAVGQIRLAHAWKELFDERGIATAQVLLTLEDTEERRRYLNARSTLDTLLGLKAIPVINENDTVATAEIRYGDNDRLAARVAQMASAECLVLLSDIDGLYTADPGKDPDAQFIPEVREISGAVEAMASGPTSGVGSGGMTTKVAAARIAVGAGCSLCIASGRRPNPLRAVEEGTRCTWFLPGRGRTPHKVRKQWIAGTLKPAGRLTVDAGCAQALTRGKSLLPAGVAKLAGRFERGDTVSVLDPEGREIARGLVAYSAEDAARIIGRRSSEIEALLGWRGREELIHRDDLVMLRDFEA